MHDRHFLPKNQTLCEKKSWFGNVELEGPSVPLLRNDVLTQVQDLEGIPLSKATNVKAQINHEKRGDNWNKKSSRILRWALGGGYIQFTKPT